MEDVEMYIKEQKLKSNLLYCIIIKKSDYLEKEFDKDISTYLVDGDGDHVAGTDVENETIYLLYIEEWKIFKMIDFFKKHSRKYQTRINEVLLAIVHDYKKLHGH